jgi:hypothetical protein
MNAIEKGVANKCKRREWIWERQVHIYWTHPKREEIRQAYEIMIKINEKSHV